MVLACMVRIWRDVAMIRGENTLFFTPFTPRLEVISGGR